jgi:hypothetical protein
MRTVRRRSLLIRKRLAFATNLCARDRGAGEINEAHLVAVGSVKHPDRRKTNARRTI